MPDISRKVFCLLSTILLGCGNADSVAPERSSSVGVVKRLGERRFEEAYAVSGKLLSDQGDQPAEALLQLHAEACTKIGRMEEAELTFGRLLAINPNSADAVRFYKQQKAELSQPQHEFTIEHIAQTIPVEPDPAYEQKPQVPKAKRSQQLNPAELVYRKYLESVALQRREQMEAETRASLEQGYDARTGWEERPMDQLPKQIVRADLGFGMPIEDILIPRVPTTGRYSPLEMLEEPPRNRMLVGCPGGLTSCAPPCFAMPQPFLPGQSGVAIVGSKTNDSSGMPSFQCSDGVDNDGNRLADRKDPNCWEDPTDPSTYSPFREEFAIDSPGFSAVPVAPVAPSTPSAVSTSVPVSAGPALQGRGQAE